MGDDDDTPARGVLLDDDSRSLADLGLACNGVAVRLGEAAGVVARLRGAEREAFRAALADQLVGLANLILDAQRELRRADGVYGPLKP